MEKGVRIDCFNQSSQFTRCQQEDRRRLSRQETPHDCNLGNICSEVDIDGTCICLSTCVTITGNYWLFVCLSSTCLMWRTLTAVLGHYTQLIFA